MLRAIAQLSNRQQIAEASFDALTSEVESQLDKIRAVRKHDYMPAQAIVDDLVALSVNLNAHLVLVNSLRQSVKQVDRSEP